MPVHIQIWTGARNARITDMTNAGKRGKTCRVMRFSGCDMIGWTHESHRAAELTDEVLGRLEGIDPDTNFEDVAAMLENAAEYALDSGITTGWFAVHEDDPIRAIDAPKPELTAGNDKWSGRLDNEGVHLRDLTDRNNEPCECTYGQTGAQAYKLAVKVWHKVQAAGTMHEASEILSAAGCKLHYWCSVD
jgi:hypothetical protein